MRILQVSPYFDPYVGGQERYVRSLARALVDRGHIVEVYTSNFPRGKKYEVMDGIKVRRFDILCRPLNNPISHTLPFHLVKHCKDFDIVHAHNEHAATSLCCAFAKSHLKIPLVVTCHGQLRFDNLAKDLFERIYNKMVGSKLLKKTDKVITLSDSDRRYLHSLGVPLEKIRVIPSGVDLARYNFELSNPRKRFRFEEKQVVLFVGPLLKRKGPQLLVKAIPFIIKEQPDVVFVFVGKGNFKEEAEKLSWKLNVEKYVCFTDYIPDNQLRYLYQRSDLVVLPSISEGFPYTILDALAFSKPVVSTLIPCFEEYLSGSALLVPPEDFKALAYAVTSLLSNEKLARNVGQRGHRLIETCFRWDLVVEKVLDVYYEL
jgi:glycosyltransferase involved in cell wall biosynthesis